VLRPLRGRAACRAVERPSARPSVAVGIAELPGLERVGDEEHDEGRDQQHGRERGRGRIVELVQADIERSESPRS
jgi:hypothetical protein